MRYAIETKKSTVVVESGQAADVLRAFDRAAVHYLTQRPGKPALCAVQQPIE
jgi:hypothetical protein